MTDLVPAHRHPAPIQPDEIIDAAADKIRERGHSRLSWANQNGGVCIQGAFAAVAQDRGLTPADIAAPMAVIEATVGDIPTWNDHVARDEGHVMELLRSSASAVRRAGP